MVRMQSPTGLNVLVNFTFERQAKLDLLDQFKRGLLELPQVTKALELEGTSDFQVEASVENLTAFHDLVERHIDPNRRLISHYEINFVLRCFEAEERDNIVWANERHGSRCIDLDRAECICAEGDYIRIWSAGSSALVHMTLHSICERLPFPPFVQIHRSTVVHAAAVRTLRHEGRRWLVELTDGTTHAIAKGRNGEVGRLIEEARCPRMSSSPTVFPFDRPVDPIDRKSAASLAR